MFGGKIRSSWPVRYMEGQGQKEGGNGAQRGARLLFCMWQGTAESCDPSRYMIIFAF